MRIKTLTVSELNNYIKKTLDNDFILNNLLVKGEVSNLKYHSSGHIYFSLKDSISKINCVMFKSNSADLDFKLTEGMEVIANARCSIYPGTGSLQLYIEKLQKEGIGELHIKFEKLKKKLQDEGYFDEQYKKEIPKMPKRIGVVTSETGAVIRDIINVSKRRSSLIDIVLYPALVQGEGAYKTIINGIKYFNDTKSVDVIIIGRGGGSIEELWNFNEEDLAKEIFKSKLPIISAVGHEVDFTISDFVSDYRASTPSQAAEIAVPLESDIMYEIDNYNKRINEIVFNKFSYEKEKLSNYKKILSLNSPEVILSNSYLELDRIEDRMKKLVFNKIEKEKLKIKSLNDILEAHNPINVLKKGYTIVEDNEKNIISSKEEIKDLDEFNIIFKDGKVKGKIISMD
ncbi:MULTISPECIES: exodeoxyribonuclease VII large subunit [Clostridium]|jgi:exodeoxyribonuclease VII large subunit|uniref:exodeoxyribonuclease VII large subunit n=1 Tax=Clostridium TaxID=1485 RepID=UPI0011578F0A|nr:MULTISPECIES: exodeoxyribonuclease VII large subunit [Clostridium]MBS5306520.1 exodeoxyribonuclease VII large subunit [Clostridium sp.]MBU6135183.1 exodeoxyribonuclease VII large subunit [Clostridium tertium]MDB1944006.1 exodeoxyribonuclease VII large subunit [Clostridium tertium]MDB1950829.1 exodeoxyribonuclease VII large subunit [Clostridium tertium]MDB1969383.1 exodeoxyribonuclease VII large subunit [Clostridium tertium]